MDYGEELLPLELNESVFLEPLDNIRQASSWYQNSSTCYESEYYDDLVNRLAEGETDVLYILIVRLIPSIYRFFSYKARGFENECDAEDLTQELILRVLQIHSEKGYPLRLKSFRSYCSYIHRIARTMINDVYRLVLKNRKNSVSIDEMIEQGWDYYQESGNYDIERQLPAIWLNIESYWHDKLPDIDKKIIKSRWLTYPPESYENIVAELGPGWTSEAVRKRHQRILERTRRHFEQKIPNISKASPESQSLSPFS